MDRVIAVDLERPGTGSGGAFLGPGIPVETLLTTNIFAEHIAEKILGKDKSHQRGVTVISVRGARRRRGGEGGRAKDPQEKTILLKTVEKGDARFRRITKLPFAARLGRCAGELPSGGGS